MVLDQNNIYFHYSTWLDTVLMNLFFLINQATLSLLKTPKKRSLGIILLFFSLKKLSLLVIGFFRVSECDH